MTAGPSLSREPPAAMAQPLRLRTLPMSVKLMTAVWQMRLNHTDKLVLLALADNANDDGFCWPGIKTICKKTCLSERGVQAALSRLIATKTLQRIIRNGKSSNFYVRPPQDMHPASNAPTPARRAPPPPQDMHPEPSYRTIKKQLGKSEEVCEEEVLPAKWHTYAENRGIPDEQIYLSWRRFKDITEFPFNARKWRAWIEKERVTKKKHL